MRKGKKGKAPGGLKRHNLTGHAKAGGNLKADASHNAAGKKVGVVYGTLANDKYGGSSGNEKCC